MAGTDSWEQIGVARNTAGYQGAATIDTDHNLYIKTASITGPYTSDLTIWDLDKANASNPVGKPGYRDQPGQQGRQRLSNPLVVRHSV